MDKILIIFFSFILILFGVAFWVFGDCAKEQNRLVDQCIESGKLEYECKAMFAHYCQSGSGNVPIVTPVYMGR